MTWTSLATPPAAPERQRNMGHSRALAHALGSLMGASHERGRRGEQIAAEHLERHGWELIERNWRAGHREIDLIVRRDSVLAFVEVKTRAHHGAGGSLEAIDARKRRDVERAAGEWLRNHPARVTKIHTLRFDAVAVELIPGRPIAVRHLPDAWRRGWP